jgi:hypothetical protein
LLEANLFGKSKQLLPLLSDPDQERIRGDLATFFGPRADRYLKVYEKLRADPSMGWFYLPGWSWAVFFGSFVWFFYRKQYLAGAAAILVPITLSLLFGVAGTTGVAIAFAAIANPWYVYAALLRIMKADTIGLQGAERADYLQRAGGVSLVAGVLAGVLYVALLGLAILGIFIDPKSVQ